MTSTDGRRVRLQILQVPDCPLVGRLIDEVQACLADCQVREQVEIVVGDYPSPTLVLDGVDVSTGLPVQAGPRCRFDLPSSDQIRDAVHSLHDSAWPSAPGPKKPCQRRDSSGR